MLAAWKSEREARRKGVWCGKLSSKVSLPAVGLHTIPGGCIGCRCLLAASDIGPAGERS